MIDHIRQLVLKFLFPKERAVGYVHHSGRMPDKAYTHDAGWDLTTSETVDIPAGAFVDIPVGLRFKLSPGVWVRITGRSSTWRKHDLQVQEGIIDSGYTGPIFIGVHNPTDESVCVPIGVRLAQAIPHRRIDMVWKTLPYSDYIPPTDGRGDSGFGSTGE